MLGGSSLRVGASHSTRPRACGASLPALAWSRGLAPCSGLLTCAQGRVTARGGFFIRFHVAAFIASQSVNRLTIAFAGRTSAPKAAIADVAIRFPAQKLLFLAKQVCGQRQICIDREIFLHECRCSQDVERPPLFFWLRALHLTWW